MVPTKFTFLLKAGPRLTKLLLTNNDLLISTYPPHLLTQLLLSDISKRHLTMDLQSIILDQLILHYSEINCTDLSCFCIDSCEIYQAFEGKWTQFGETIIKIVKNNIKYGIHNTKKILQQHLIQNIEYKTHLGPGKLSVKWDNHQALSYHETLHEEHFIEITLYDEHLSTIRLSIKNKANNPKSLQKLASFEVSRQLSDTNQLELLEIPLVCQQPIREAFALLKDCIVSY